MPADDIDRFFVFFKRRVLHARGLCAPGEAYAPMEPDLHVLVSAGLDALARYWANTFRPNVAKGSAALRMGEFLLQHGDERIFAKCSAPNLLHRATIEAKTALLPLISKYLHNEGPPGTVRTWEDDPNLAHVVRDFSTVKGADAGWLRLSRYGELLYKEYRCMWLHQFQPSPRFASSYAPDEPWRRYQNLVVPAGRAGQRTPIETTSDAMGNSFERIQLLMFSRAFMLSTYESAVAGFETECIASGTAPVID